MQARHISYQLNFITVSPFSVSGCAGAMQGLKSHAASECPFSVWTDVASSAMFTVSVPASFRSCLGGMDGSVLDTFGGEFEWDRYTVKFHRARGADHNVHIVYGKNLTDFKMEKSIENTITGVHPYWVDNETQAVMELPEKVVMVSRKFVPYQKITVLDCTSAFQEKPSEAALREYAQDYIDTTSLTEPEIDIKIDFIQLWNTPGYEDIVEAEQVVVQMNQLTFQTAEEVLRDSVVVGIALSGHTLLNSQLFQTEAKSSGSILYASVAVEDQPCARTLPGYCHIQGIQSKLCVDPVGESVSYYFFGT